MSDSVRVLHVVRRYAPLLGGTERYVKDLAEAQARSGSRVTVLTLDRDVTAASADRLAPDEVIGGVLVRRLSGTGGHRFAVTFRPDLAARAIAAADVVHLHDLRFLAGLVAATSAVRRRPLLFHTHGLIFHTQWGSRIKEVAMRAYFGPALQLSRAWVLASSDADRKRLLRSAPGLARRTVTVPNAIALDQLLTLDRRPRPGRVVTIGRVTRSKAIDALLRALAEVDVVNWSLAIVGPAEPDERRRLEDEAVRLRIRERVELVGPVSDPARNALLAEASVAAFPSTGEGFGLALLEAMAAGVPVLANDIPAHREVLGPYLEDRLVDFGDSGAVARALTTLMAPDPSDSFLRSVGERERVVAGDYDVGRLVAQIDELYRELGVADRARKRSRSIHQKKRGSSHR